MIPIPSRDDPEGGYLLAVLMLAGLAGPAIAAHLHTRWELLRRWPLLVWHALIAALVVLAGVLLLGSAVWMPTGPVGVISLVAGIPAGLLVAVVVIRADRVITVWWGARFGTRLGRSGPRVGQPRPAGVAGQSAAAGLRRTGLVQARNDFTPTAADLRVSMPLLLVVACMEELVYRGVLLAVAIELGGFVAAIGVQVVFALMHVFFGWGQVLAKIPLAALTTVAVVLTGTVLPAVLGHGLFNIWVCRYRAAMPRRGGSGGR